MEGGMSELSELFCGIDVSKAALDVATESQGRAGAAWRVNTDAAGVQELVTRLTALAPALIVLQATGGYELPVAAALGAAGLTVAVINPRQGREFAKAIGALAKTDQLDAALLAHFAAVIRPPARPLPDDHQQRVAALLARRRQVVEMVEMRTAEHNRLGTALPVVRARIEQHLAWLDAELDTLDTELRQQIKASPVWRENDELLQSVKGVGRSPA